MTEWTRPVTLWTVTNPEEPLDWTTRAEPLDPTAAAAPVPVPLPTTPPLQQFLPPPSPPNVTYLQPVARRGLTGPQAAVLIAVLVIGLPVLCCLGAMVLGIIGSGQPTSTSP